MRNGDPRSGQEVWSLHQRRVMSFDAGGFIPPASVRLKQRNGYGRPWPSCFGNKESTTFRLLVLIGFQVRLQARYDSVFLAIL